ncbi:MAG: Na+/H+ antiporter subunit E [Actinobacteria bacterium]|nr:Na+/H+ antiporter subunit E [Actinomycetota bacterium]
MTSRLTARAIMPSAGRAAALVAMWVALQGEVTVGNVVGGIVVVGCIEALFPMGRRAEHRFHPWGAARFAAALARDLVVSSWQVAVAVVRPDADRIHTEVISVDIETRSSLVASLVANAITLTPGTMTVEIEPTPVGHRLAVHVLGRIDPDGFRDQVSALERRVVAAVSPVGSVQPVSDVPPGNIDGTEGST